MTLITRLLIKLLIVGSLTGCLNIALFRAFFLFKAILQPRSNLNTTNHDKLTLTKPMVDRFMGALSIPTISHGFNSSSGPALLELIEFIEKSYPMLHGAPFIKREIIANYSLLYTVKGTDLTLRPYMFCSHLDIVPAEKEHWESDPYTATHRADNYIYARGAIDAKHLLMGMLEAVDLMLKSGFRPKRSFLMAFGHDEELSGREGAKSIAELLKERLSQQLLYVLDEGGIISRSRFPGLDYQIGFVGVAEKGYLTVKVSTKDPKVGHASMPTPQTAITRLAHALTKFHSNLMPSFIGLGVEKAMFDEFACHAAWPYRLLYSNVWLFNPLLDYVFGLDNTLNSLIRTTTAVTMIEGGTKDNVLPSSATAYINHRVHPLHTIEQVIEIDKETIADETITVEAVPPTTKPSPVSPYCEDCYGFQLIKHSILQIQPQTVVVPALFLGATDSRWYENLTDSIYKFSAIGIPLSEMHRFHGHNERIHLVTYEALINFYHHLILNSDEANLPRRKTRREEL